MEVMNRKINEADVRENNKRNNDIIREECGPIAGFLQVKSSCQCVFMSE